MTDYHWPSVREQLVELFGGELPHPETEDEIIQAFSERPRSVLVTAAEIAKSQTPPRSHWAVLRKRLTQVGTAKDISATDSSEKERKIINARRWLHNAGCYFDLERDVIDELFGSQGILAGHDSEALRSEMIEAWRQERPRGIAAEQEHEAYMSRVKAQKPERFVRKPKRTTAQG